MSEATINTAKYRTGKRLSFIYLGAAFVALVLLTPFVTPILFSIVQTNEHSTYFKEITDDSNLFDVRCIMERQKNSSILKIVVEDLPPPSYVFKIDNSLAQTVEDSGFWTEIKENDIVYITAHKNYNSMTYVSFGQVIGLRSESKTYVDLNVGRDILRTSVSQSDESYWETDVPPLIVASVIIGAIGLGLFVAFFSRYFYCKRKIEQALSDSNVIEMHNAPNSID